MHKNALLLLLFLVPLFSLAQNTKNKKSKISVTTSLANTEMKTQIVDSSFIIADNPKKDYSGFYKKNKPYNGYFKAGDYDVFWVDFYKNGEKINQYSYDILTNLIEEEKKEGENGYSESSKKLLNISSAFKNGKNS